MQAEDPVEFLWIVQYGAMRVGGVLREYGEAQGHQLTGGIIDEHDQGAARTATLEPVMG